MPIDLKKVASFGSACLLALCYLWNASMVVQAAPPTLPGYAHLLNHSDISSSQRGELLLGELQCVACHETDPASADRIWVRQAPDLSAIGSRVTPQFLTDYLKNPRGFFR